MSEQAKQNHERHSSPETVIEQHNIPQNTHESSLEAKHEHAEHIEHIRANIEHEANKAELTKEKLQSSSEKQPEHHYATKKIKSDQYKKTLSSVRQELPKNEQRFSMFIHQPVVEKISEVGSKTIARPSGILGGALFALAGSLIVTYIARHIGFEVPGTIFAVLFLFGFLFGLFVELLIGFINQFRPKHRKQKKFYR